ncbi:unnamed protein product [Caenorhabditis bovis]|uniref:Uncharacterized protein n=1 Tax=Caenorhabditis bovis TaxID=2654633 RepID=A0A8S1FFL8_9PELO|nr:unnamed protein product [Caenorhabditis bovis]
MSEEYITQYRSCAYILGPEGTARLYDFQGVYILDGGHAEKTIDFLQNVRSICGVYLSAPTKNTIGTAYALAQKNRLTPLIANVPKLKASKPGTTGAALHEIQQQSHRADDIKPVFHPKYEPYLIYRSLDKGTLYMYVLAGDVKDGEAIAKALQSGNEEHVEKAAAEHGTVAVLLWKPVHKDERVSRVLLTGTCSMARIQASLDRAAKFLPFLNKAVVTSHEAFSAIPPPPSLAAPPPPPLSRGDAGRGAAASRSDSKPSLSRPATSTRSTPSAPTAPRTAASRPSAPAPRTRAAPTGAAPPTRRAPPPAAPSANGRRKVEEVVQKTTVRGTQRAAPTSTRAPPASKPAGKPSIPSRDDAKKSTTAPLAKKPSAPSAQQPVAAPPSAAPVAVPPVVVDLDDSVVCLDDVPTKPHAPSLDIVVIPPTPEPPRETPDILNDVDGTRKEEEPQTKPDDVEPEIPPPIDVTKKPDPIEPTPPEPIAPTPHIDPIPEPIVPTPHIDPTPPAPIEPEVAVPFTPQVPTPVVDPSLVIIDEKQPAEGFDQPIEPQKPRDDGLLPDCGEEIPVLKKISMDTDRTTDEAQSTTPVQAAAVGEVTMLADDVARMSLDGAEALGEQTAEYVRKLSAQMIHDAATPFTSGFASNIVDDFGKAPENGAHEPPKESNGVTTNGVAEEPLKHDLMKNRSTVLEHDKPVEYEKTDPVIDVVLEACASESEHLDAAQKEPQQQSTEPSPMPTMFMLNKPGVLYKGPRFARCYYFDVATIPHNEDGKITLEMLQLAEFTSKIRARHYIVHSKDIAKSALEGIFDGKKKSVQQDHPTVFYPTHHSPILSDFKREIESYLSSTLTSFQAAVDRQITKLTASHGESEYKLARFDILD